MEIVLFLIVLTGAAATGYAVLTAVGMEDREAWAYARIVGPALVVLPGWWIGSIVSGVWAAVGTVVLIAGTGWGLFILVRRGGREILAPEAVFWASTAGVLMLRISRPAIVQTEKLMDLGILTTLTRTASFPPPDFWLSGNALPYYYWGSLIWAFPLRISGLDPGVGYNLIVALLAGASATALWALGSRLAGGRWAAGATAAFFGVFAGTVDGLLQLVGGFGPRAIDLWRSSRQVEHAITEFPLFSFWLGDLHPHLLSLAPAAAAIGVAAFAGSQRRLRAGAVIVAAALFGLTWAANPWAFPPTLTAIALMLICGGGVWHWPDRRGWVRWAAAAGVAAGGWLVAVPFHLAFHPPPHPIRPVFAWTPPLDLFLYAGLLLAPVFIAIVRISRNWFEGDSLRVSAVLVAAGAATIVGGVLTGRPTIVILCVGISVLVAAVLRPEHDDDRPAVALAALGLFLFLVPELVYLEDGYGAELHRMNTIFKAYFQGWMLLAVCLPMMIRIAGKSVRGRRLLLAGITVVAMPHLLGTVVTSTASGGWGIDGLRWMGADDRAVVEALKELPPDASMIEAVGDAYSRYGRLSSASGVPAYLGWANHELVWRGPEIVEETRRREAAVREIYSSNDCETVRKAVEAAGVSCVAVGRLEVGDFDRRSLEILREAGDRVIPCGEGGALVLFDRAEAVRESGS